jgi:hypothetical protein
VKWIFEIELVLMLGMVDMLMERLLLRIGGFGGGDGFDFTMTEAEQHDLPFSASASVNLGNIMA